MMNDSYQVMNGCRGTKESKLNNTQSHIIDNIENYMLQAGSYSATIGMSIDMLSNKNHNATSLVLGGCWNTESMTIQIAMSNTTAPHPIILWSDNK